LVLETPFPKSNTFLLVPPREDRFQSSALFLSPFPSTAVFELIFFLANDVSETSKRSDVAINRAVIWIALFFSRFSVRDQPLKLIGILWSHWRVTHSQFGPCVPVSLFFYPPTSFFLRVQEEWQPQFYPLAGFRYLTSLPPRLPWLTESSSSLPLLCPRPALENPTFFLGKAMVPLTKGTSAK